MIPILPAANVGPFAVTIAIGPILRKGLVSIRPVLIVPVFVVIAVAGGPSVLSSEFIPVIVVTERFSRSGHGIPTALVAVFGAESGTAAGGGAEFVIIPIATGVVAAGSSEPTIVPVVTMRSVGIPLQSKFVKRESVDSRGGRGVFIIVITV